MTGEEIKKAIEDNNIRIEKILLKDTFLLNAEIHHLMTLNDNYRKECPHEYDQNGICKYCMADKIGD